MSFARLALIAAIALAAVGLAGCQANATPAAKDGRPRVLATASFLADIAQNVAGDRLRVESLVPVGVDPHAFEPTPADAVKVAQSQVVIANGAGFETFLGNLLRSAGGNYRLVEASAGLSGRKEAGGEQAGEVDPHFWLTPNLVVRYVENIRDGLSAADPAGAATYEANARRYTAELEELDRWIAQQVSAVPAENRRLVTNHESLGYFAERYGFQVVGTVVPGTNPEASPSARSLAELIATIKATGVRAIFLETGTNPQMAQQIAREAGVQVVTQLYSHSLTEPGGPAPTYLEMMRHNTRAIVEALR